MMWKNDNHIQYLFKNYFYNRLFAEHYIKPIFHSQVYADVKPALNYPDADYFYYYYDCGNKSGIKLQ